MRISDWSSDVCSSDLTPGPAPLPAFRLPPPCLQGIPIAPPWVFRGAAVAGKHAHPHPQAQRRRRGGARHESHLEHEYRSYIFVKAVRPNSDLTERAKMGLADDQTLQRAVGFATVCDCG